MRVQVALDESMEQSNALQRYARSSKRCAVDAGKGAGARRLYKGEVEGQYRIWFGRDVIEELREWGCLG